MDDNARKLGKSAGNRGKGRPKGVPNKTTAALKEAILLAAEQAGGPGGTVAYLRQQAIDNPAAFMTLLGKVLPMQVHGDPSAPLITRVERIIVKAANPDA